MKRRLAPILALAGLISLFGARVAYSAPGDATRLSYAHTTAAACPDREALRAAVAKHLGYDPFFAVARQAVEVDIDADAERLTANMRFINEDGIIVGKRQLHEQPENCDELIAALALAISITLDPSAALENPHLAETSPSGAQQEGEPSAPEEPSSADVMSAGPKRTQPPSAVPSVSAHSRALLLAPTWSSLWRVGPVVAGGRLPATALGARMEGGARYGAFQGSLEFDGFLPVSRASNLGGSVVAGLVSAALVPCYAAQRWAACALFDVGVVTARGRGVPAPQRERELYAALGLRAALRQPLGARWALVATFDVTKTLNPLKLLLHDVPVWQAPPWSGAGALAMELGFP